MRVTVQPYDPTWPTSFSQIASSLHSILKSVPILSIEHVGSTSVLGLAAKPILDIDIVVSRPSLEPAINALKTAGFTYRGDRGIPDRYAFDSPPPLEGEASTGDSAVVEESPVYVKRNIYICIENSLHLRNHLVVRDTLRRDATLRDEYARVKLALAQRDFSNIDEYVEGKSEVLGRIMKAGGIGGEEVEEIGKVNVVGAPRG